MQRDEGDTGMPSLLQLATAYIEALYFTETGEHGQCPLDTPLDPTFKQECLRDCTRFFEAVKGFVPDSAWAQAGHDLWLTRNGHGSGFWDRAETYGEDVAKWLTAVARAMGDVEPVFEEGAG